MKIGPGISQGRYGGFSPGGYIWFLNRERRNMSYSFNKIKISYGDRHYLIEFCGDVHIDQEDYYKHKVMSYLYQVLRDFHGSEIDNHDEIWKMRDALHELAHRHPESKGIIEKALGLRS